MKKVKLTNKMAYCVNSMINIFVFSFILFMMVTLSSCEIPKIGVDIDKDGKDDITIDIPNMWNKNNE